MALLIALLIGLVLIAALVLVNLALVYVAAFVAGRIVNLLKGIRLELSQRKHG